MARNQEFKTDSSDDNEELLQHRSATVCPRVVVCEAEDEALVTALESLRIEQIIEEECSKKKISHWSVQPAAATFSAARNIKDLGLTRARGLLRRLHAQLDKLESIVNVKEKRTEKEKAEKSAHHLATTLDSLDQRKDNDEVKLMQAELLHILCDLQPDDREGISKTEGMYQKIETLLENRPASDILKVRSALHATVFKSKFTEIPKVELQDGLIEAIKSASQGEIEEEMKELLKNMEETWKTLEQDEQPNWHRWFMPTNVPPVREATLEKSTGTVFRAKPWGKFANLRDTFDLSE